MSVFKQLWVQVLLATLAGIALGHWWPKLGADMKPLGDAFVALVRMLIAPVIFCTVVHGVGAMNDMRRVGRVALKALIYFEVITTLALVLALTAVNLLQPLQARTAWRRHCRADGRNELHATTVPLVDQARQQ